MKLTIESEVTAYTAPRNCTIVGTVDLAAGTAKLESVTDADGPVSLKQLSKWDIEFLQNDLVNAAQLQAAQAGKAL